MRAFALALLLSPLLLAPVAHADEELWRGFYGGVGVGGGDAHSTWVTDATFGTLDEQVEHKGRGAVGGLQWGYRKPVAGPLLLGAEIAWYGGKIEDRSEANIVGAANRERVTKIRNPGSLAALLGLAGSRSLFYVRGGVAFAQVELQAINHQVGNIATWEGTGYGWTAGTGVELFVHRRLTLALEYNYARLKAEDQKTTNSGGVEVRADDFKTNVRLGLLRLNYNY